MIVLMPASNPIHQLVREPTATPTATTPPSAAAKPSNPFIITPIRISIQVKGVFSIDKEAPSNEGAFLVPTTPPSGSHRGWGTGDCGGELAESLGKSFPWAVGFFFGDLELSLELWTVIAGISGLDD